MVSEQDIADFFLALDTYSSIVTKECKEATKPFICRYAFPTCNDNGSYQFITKDECMYLQHDICASEWLVALSFAPELVPDCEQLNNNLDVEFEPSDVDFEQSNVNSSSSAAGMTNKIDCPENFGVFCNDKCLPLCSQFSQYNEITTTIRSNIDIFAATLAIVGGVLSIILILIRRRKM